MAIEVRELGVAGTIPGTGFTKAHQLFRETVRRFIDQEINPYVDQWEEAETFPAHDLFKKAGDQGFLGLSYPEEYGGAGADYWYNMAFAEELGAVNCGGIPMGIGVQTDMATPAAQSIWHARAQEEVSGAGDPRRRGLFDCRDRGRRRIRRGFHSHQGRACRR